MKNKSPLHSNIRIQAQDFSVDSEYRYLRALNPKKVGAICSFVGLVREFGDQEGVTGLFLEHYPGMTENSLQKIIDQASIRWTLDAVTVIHRIGKLRLSDQIVFVAVSSAHRGDAFAACEFIMDYLKTAAPFWKKEINTQGSEWVEAKQSDLARSKKWSQD